MVNNRRSELDIISELLKLSKGGAKKTELLYQGNLSYVQLKGYLMFLMEKNILEERIEKNGHGFSKMYYMTEKGGNLLVDINRTLSYFK